MKNLTVANEILRQLGGRKFIAMTGVKNLAGGEDHLQMHLVRNLSKAKYLSIKLEANDTYTMTFSKLDRNYNLIIIKEIENVYADQLQEIYTSVTGQHTRL